MNNLLHDGRTEPEGAVREAIRRGPHHELSKKDGHNSGDDPQWVNERVAPIQSETVQ